MHLRICAFALTCLGLHWLYVRVTRQAKDKLKTEYKDDMTIKDALKLSATVLSKTMDVSSAIAVAVAVEVALCFERCIAMVKTQDSLNSFGIGITIRIRICICIAIAVVVVVLALPFVVVLLFLLHHNADFVGCSPAVVPFCSHPELFLLLGIEHAYLGESHGGAHGVRDSHTGRENRGHLAPLANRGTFVVRRRGCAWAIRFR